MKSGPSQNAKYVPGVGQVWRNRTDNVRLYIYKLNK